ncbi:MAG: hypothetical protein ACOYLX_12235 [Burkholderiaceae bacterium]
MHATDPFNPSSNQAVAAAKRLARTLPRRVHRIDDETDDQVRARDDANARLARELFRSTLTRDAR